MTASYLGYSPIIAVITLILLIASITGVAAAYFRTNLVKTQIEILKATNEAQADRIEFLEDEDTRKDARIESLQKAVDVLERVVTGKEMLVEIKDLIIAHKKDTHDISSRLFQDMEEMLDTMGEIKAGIKP